MIRTILITATATATLMHIVTKNYYSEQVHENFVKPLSTILEPCATEDSINCVWEARERGNGKGLSYIDINGGFYPYYYTE